MGHRLMSRKRLLVLCVVVAALSGAAAAIAQQIGQSGSQEPPHTPNLPAISFSTVQPPAIQPSGSPTAAPSPTGARAPASLADIVRDVPKFGPVDWVPARSTNVPLTALIPPTFTAKFSAFNRVAGSGQVYELAIFNPAAASRAPMPEGATPPPGDMTLNVQLYPSGPIVPAQPSSWPVVERASLMLPLTAGPLAVTHYHNTEGGADVLIVEGKFMLPDGRILDILGRTTSPESTDAVTTLLKMALSIEVN